MSVAIETSSVRITCFLREGAPLSRGDSRGRCEAPDFGRRYRRFFIRSGNSRRSVPLFIFDRAATAKDKPMRAVLCREWGDPESLVIGDVPSRPLAPDEVRIRVRASGVNFADTLQIAGKYQVRPPFPFTPGLEVAGEIAGVGEAVHGLKPGTRVMAPTHGNAFAEEVIVPAVAAVPIPAAMDYTTAAAFPVAYGTSHWALAERGALCRGETLLVLGAAGGVGLTAVEIGKAMGARVIAAAGSPEKLAIARAHGADDLIDYARESVRDRVRALTGGLGADVVFDPVGGDAFDQAIRAVNWKARMLVVGFAAGRIQAVPANLVLVKNISIVGVAWGLEGERDAGVISTQLVELLRWWEAGKLKPRIARTYPLAETAAAMRALLSR
ncbi:MAG TPA: NADPH:quinone oxidoreductase family protein, partial [Stellaceae bacterium]|nr:NADPH:quinone oxidoreductase family protein [Stellaceae bacterium]